MRCVCLNVIMELTLIMVVSVNTRGHELHSDAYIRAIAVQKILSALAEGVNRRWLPK
jgi:hypothetical protein